MFKAKKFLALALAIVMIAPILSSCQVLCEHKWADATCERPKTCILCEKTEGTILPHSWEEATCETPKTCSVCSLTEGVAQGHVWVKATCETPKTCSVCHETVGIALGHVWNNATCDNPKTCSVCSDTEGDPLEHSFKEEIIKEATCDHDGEKKLTCELCNDKKIETYKKTTYSATEIHDLYASSVGEIIIYDKSGRELSLGSCFVYSEDGKILTNYHVIDGAYSIKVTLGGKEYKVSYVLAYDKEIDIAVLQIPASGLKAADLCANDHKAGSPVYAFGSSKGLTATFSQGIITYSNRDLDGVKYTQHDAAISSGNSGGPLINEYGEVVGINTLTIRDSQNLNFAISISELSNLNFSTKLTVAQYYEKECDVVKKMKNYVMKYGTKESDGDYNLIFSTTYSSDYSSKYRSVLCYDVSKDEIMLMYISDSSSGDSYSIGVFIDTIDGTYDWGYVDSHNYKMSGVIYASTFTDNTLLGYSYNNITSSSIRSTVRELASLMVINLLYNIDKDLSSIGVTTYDLGFTSF